MPALEKARSTLESKALKSNGIVLRSDEIIEERQTGMPYLDYEVFFPKPYEVKLYFKPPMEVAQNKMN